VELPDPEDEAQLAAITPEWTEPSGDSQGNGSEAQCAFPSTTPFDPTVDHTSSKKDGGTRGEHASMLPLGAGKQQGASGMFPPHQRRRAAAPPIR